MRTVRYLAAIFCCLMLTGCLWGPGKFNSELLLRKDGSFILDYEGEIMVQIPEDEEAAWPWSNDLATCRADGSAEANLGRVMVSFAGEGRAGEDRAVPCSEAQLARLKTEFEHEANEQKSKRNREMEQRAQLLGLPGRDDESNRRFAATLMKYAGWQRVIYKGNGLFDVDYHYEGKLTHDYAFPMMPDADFIIPFITIRRRQDGSVLVSAPAFAGNPMTMFAARARMLNMEQANGNEGPPSHAQGRFTIITDGEILTNNSEDGPSAISEHLKEGFWKETGQRRVQWDIGSGYDKVPEMLVKL